MIVLLIMLLAACSTDDGNGGLSAEDELATAVAQALTATATAEAARATETVVPTATTALPSATATDIPEVQITPTPTEANAPVPTPPIFIVQGAPGDRNGITGDVFTFAGIQSDPERQVYQDEIVFLVNGVHAADGEPVEGEGILDINFIITEADGTVVHEQLVTYPLYCAFGGDENTCDIYRFSENSNRWPNGLPVHSGPHNAGIDGRGVDPDNTAFWTYDFIIERPNTVLINNIALDGNRYVVDFESFGFEPTWGAQHVHFFFNTVSPEKAGVGEPNAGPWQLYPSNANEDGSSPFTLYTVQDRPAGATQICILVANPDHSINPDTGNCYPLP
jgi:hypothetical protein